MATLFHFILYTIIFHHGSSYHWIITQSTDFYNDWDDMNREWYNIRQIHTANGNRIQRKCTTYSAERQLCLCQFLPRNIPNSENTQHFCFITPQQYTQSLNYPHFVMDHFANDAVSPPQPSDSLTASAIQNGLKFYIQSMKAHKELPIDSIFLLKLISKNELEYTKIANTYYHTLQEQRNKDYYNPFNRIFSKKAMKRLNHFKISRHNNQYSVKKQFLSYFVDPTDSIVMKALFCDITGFDTVDFDILIKMAKRGYYNTHIIIALNLLEVNGCYDSKKIFAAMSKVSKTILVSLRTESRSANNFGDLFFERIVCLYWAGFGDYVDKGWIVRIAKHQSKKDYGWSHDYKQSGKYWVAIHSGSQPHPTGLALLAMIYYEIGESKQYFYPVNILYI